MKNTNHIKQKEIKDKNNVVKRLTSLKSNQCRTVLGDKGFYYYTTLDTFSKIYESKRIWIRNVGCMNDKKEFTYDDKLTKNKAYNHLFCLCNSDSESIPMWYMYSENKGNGARIKFPPSAIKEIILNAKVILPDNTIMKSEYYNIEAGWVYYRYKNNRYKLNNKSYTIEDMGDAFYKKNRFIKSYHWLYEKEFRILVENNTDEAYEHLELDLSKCFDKLSFMFGPEFDYKNLKEYKNLTNTRRNKKFSVSNLFIDMAR